MNTKKNQTDKMIYILFAVFYFWMAAQIPYTHDDWDWGLSVGIEQWLTASVNSRYVGNFFEVVMTRSPALKTLIMGAGFFALPYLFSSMVTKFDSAKRDHKLLLFLAASFLMLTMSRKVWCETYGWVAGFANFSISSIFMLLCISIWMPLTEQDYVPQSPTKKFTALCFLISLLGQLFIENLSILMAAVAIAACVLSYIRAKRIPAHYIWMAIGTVIGLAIMFSSSVYSSLLSTGEAVDGYRQLIIATEGGLTAKLMKFVTHCARLAVRAGETNAVLCISVLAVLTLGLKKCSAKKLLKHCILAVNGILVVYFLVNFILQSDYSADSPIRAAAAAMVNAVYFLGVLIEVWVIYRDNKFMKWKLIAIWCMGIGILAPLIVTTESGYRLMFNLNVMVVLFVLTVVYDFVEARSEDELRKPIKAAIIAALIPVVICFVVYTAIGACTTERLTRIEEAAATQADTLTLPQYPYESYLHYPDPSMEYRWAFFREFYGIADHVEITIEPNA